MPKNKPNILESRTFSRKLFCEIFRQLSSFRHRQPLRRFYATVPRDGDQEVEQLRLAA